MKQKLVFTREVKSGLIYKLDNGEVQRDPKTNEVFWKNNEGRIYTVKENLPLWCNDIQKVET